MECTTILLLFTFSLTVAAPPSVTKHYRTDYVYNRKTDAFYKLHPESISRWNMISACTVEGASPLVVTSDQDLVQVHAMMKKFPDLGEFAWVADDGQNHESAEEQPIVDLDTSSDELNYEDYRNCDVVTRGGAVKSTYCLHRLPFVCKVEATNASYNEQCGVYGTGYVFVPSVGSCYKIPRVAYTWDQAAAECRAEGAHLAVINSAQEAHELKTLTSSVQHVPDSRDMPYFHIGFRAVKVTAPRVFKTIFNETLEEAGFSTWARGEPTNADGNESCGSFFRTEGKLNDLKCFARYAFICEKEVNSTSSNAVARNPISSNML